MRSHVTVIIKPTHECNLSCKYCCVEKNAATGRMDSKTLENATEQVMKLRRDSIHWIWHGGEPTLMGMDFFEEAIRLQGKYQNGHRIRNSIQTNSTLIDDKFLDFLINNQFSISSSLDGPEEINNLTRVYSDGRGSFKDAWKTIQIIRERGKKIGIICVLTKKNISSIDKIYNFFRENNISLKINPLINIGKAVDNKNELEIEGAEYGIYLVKLFEKWFYEKDIGININPLSNILRSFISGENNIGSCHSSGQSYSCRDNFISIDPLGDVYPCGKFCGVEEYLLGNIHELNLQDILNSTKHIEMDNRCRTLAADGCADACKTCRYIKICSSRCLHNAYLKDRTYNKINPYCSSYKILFNHIEKALNNELKKAEV